MKRPTAEQAKAWMAQWRAAEPALARVRAAELRSVDLIRVAAELDEALRASMRGRALSETSGLVEQQRIFARARLR